MRIHKSWILNVGDFKSVRKIPVSSMSLTGEVLGQEFESSLERDLIFLMSWEDSVDWFQVQPIKVRYQSKKTYTPDLLVCFYNGMHWLCEVKYHKDLQSNWSELRPKFKAATAYAKSQGWIFKIFTEDKIRTPKLNNIKFLWSYKFSNSYPAHDERLLFKLHEIGETSILNLLSASYPQVCVTARSEALWSIWCLIARKRFLCDLSAELSMNTLIRLNPDFPLAI